ncbi:MAG: transglutaminase-like domain-containing protein [Methanobacteriaceae archaeon]|nr:transglutaminase-like domain-containing protein [Methanobacteriaceae archaeon]
MVLFISLGSVYAASDVESADFDNGILNSVDENSPINHLEVEINSNDNDSGNCNSGDNINSLNAIDVKDIEDNDAVSLSASSNPSFTISQIMDSSVDLKSYVLANQKLPDTVKVNGKEISIAQFSYLMTVAVKKINAKDSSNIECPKLSTSSPFGDSINKNIDLKDYVVVAGNIISFVKTNNYLPNYATVGGIKTEFKVYTYAFAKILVFYKEEKYLPNYCLFDSGVFNAKSPSSNSSSNTNSSSSSSTTVTISQIITSSVSLKSYVLKNGALPSTVTVNGVKYSTAQFAYLMSVAIQKLNAKKSVSTKITVPKVTVKSGSNYSVSKTLSLANCVSMAKTISSSVSSSGSVPAYVTISGTKYDYRDYTYAFAKILVWYKDNKKVLPKTCAFESKVFKSSSSSGSSSSSSVTVTISQIIASSVNLKSYVLKNGALPSTVKVNGVDYSTPQFAYLMSVAIQKLNAKKSVSTKIAIAKVSLKAGSNYSVSKTLSLASCVSMAKTISSSVSSSGSVPAYVTVSGTKYDYRDYTYGFAKILAWYKDNKNVLPKTCAFESKVFKTTPTVTISQIIESSVNLKAYVLKNGVLPTTVKVNGVNYSTEQFAYLMSVAIQNLNAKKSVSTKIAIPKVTVKSGSTYNVEKTLSLASCVAMAKTISSSVSSSGSVPAYVTVSGTNYDYRDYTYAFAKILAWYKNNKNTLPKTCLFESKVFKSSAVISGVTYKKGINEVGSADSASYLASAGNAIITTSIKNLASSLTKNCKTDLEKATALFNYVKNNIDYSYYYNTKYKASGTLSNKQGNCCDKSNLLVALCRASGLSTRYCHSTSCTFNSGLVCGHVWTQININGVWYVADTTSSRNAIGYINNWNINSVSSVNQYATLPF